jgi:hypothetical protein
MAVADLDRHLKAGWQTIVTAAGAVAALSAGQQGYLPIPLAVSLALIVSFWGIENIVDSNLWSLRAIAFLANVEAVYFYKDDQRFFNPYAGLHPPFKLMGSLKSQFYAVVLVACVSILFLIMHVAQRAGSLNALAFKFTTGSYVKVGLWWAPIILLVFLTYRALSAWKNRISDYLDFVQKSPGPGMVENRAEFRPLDPAPEGSPVPSPVTIVSGAELQKTVREQLEISHRRWNTWFPRIQFLHFALILLLLLVLIFKSKM